MTEPWNHYSARASSEKLRGRYFTPHALARLILERLAVRPGDLVVDPACGDGEFLVAAVHLLADAGVATAARLIEGVAGVELHAETAAVARANVAAAISDRTGEHTQPDSIRVICTSALDLQDRGALFTAVGHRRHADRLIVAGNPPYVDAKRLPADVRRRLLAQQPGAGRGAPDLYIYFLQLVWGWLRGEDRLGLIVPNKLLVSANGQEFREVLLAEQGLLGIDFASHLQLFPDAAVYPIVVYASRTVDGGRPSLRRLAVDDGRLTPGPAIVPPPEAYTSTKIRVIFPWPEGEDEASALTRLLASPGPRLSEVLDIRWSVSFHRAGLRETYVHPTRPNTPNAQRFLGGGPFFGNGEVRRHSHAWAGWWIDYDEARARADSNPLPPLSLFTPPKIIICQNGRTLRAAYDEAGYVLKDTFFVARPLDPGSPMGAFPRAVVGLLCSPYIHFLYSHLFHGSRVGSGYLHFLVAFLQQLPAGEWGVGEAARAAELVRVLESDPSAPGVEAELNDLVANCLGLTPADRTAAARWCRMDPNWLRRDRIPQPGTRKLHPC